MERTTVHLIRHGQSTFNAACAALPFADPMLFDAPLSERGHGQVADLRGRVAPLGVELVVTSPLTRALQTAIGGFGGGPAPIVVEALVRESLESSCDVGRSPRVLAAEFPNLRFDHLDDPWWHTDDGDSRPVPSEPQPMLVRRIEMFRAWLERRPERTIAVVGHGTFFNVLTGLRMDNCEIATIML